MYLIAQVLDFHYAKSPLIALPGQVEVSEMCPKPFIVAITNKRTVHARRWEGVTNDSGYQKSNEHKMNNNANTRTEGNACKQKGVEGDTGDYTRRQIRCDFALG